MKKIVKRFLLALVLIPVTLLGVGTVAYLLYGLLALGGESLPHQAYLRKHLIAVRPGEAGSSLAFEPAFYRNQLFLLGEAHGFAAPQELDYQLLKHLNEKAGVTHYLAEVDYSQAHFLNEYLRTGNESLLRYVFGTWVRANAQWGNGQFYEKIKKIRTLNQSLPAARRIRFFGVDRIQEAAVTGRYLRELRSTAGWHESLAAGVDSLAGLTAAADPDLPGLSAAAGALLKRLAADSVYQTGTDSHRFSLTHTLRNLVYLAPATPRDSVMYLNLKTLSRALSLEHEKMYGLWGFFHTLQIPMQRDRRVMPFAAHLQSSGSPFRGKVVSLNAYVLDGENMMPGKRVPAAIGKGKPYFNTTWANGDGPLVFVYGIRDLRAITRPHSVTIFNLVAKNSPYPGSPRLSRVKVLIPGQSLSPAPDAGTGIPAYQYVVLIRNTQALTPLRE
ncbi:MAG: hypothetical protein AVDCRST_MAG56-286 [uncultured Cytophagales bacterium]|uniref:Erythromycin esterase family protein n=1 Tax=uncultured Cytophagales bacterium TaxID=158755 RepID=A0A6J4H9K8_9SPHI|nr:MAG: hypothetical protein AVDCRST_MAG56-286 [uncultured Cytophagales bacterium]